MRFRDSGLGFSVEGLGTHTKYSILGTWTSSGEDLVHHMRPAHFIEHVI